MTLELVLLAIAIGALVAGIVIYRLYRDRPYWRDPNLPRPPPKPVPRPKY